MWIRIIKESTWKKLQDAKKELEELRGAHLNLHELQKGLYQKYLTETNELSDTLKQRDLEIEDLQKKLRKAEHDKSEALKKLKKYQEYEKAGL